MRIRGVSFLAAIAILVGPLHGALVSHSYCPAHGGMVHGDHHHVADSVETTRVAHFQNNEEAEHEHCGWRALTSEIQILNPSETIGTIQLGEEPIASSRFDADGSKLYLQYPKNSPPLLA